MSIRADELQRLAGPAGAIRRLGTGCWCRSNQMALRTPSACRGYPVNWCSRPGLEPASAAYRAAALPLCYGSVGVTDGCWPRFFGSTDRRVHWFTTATIETGDQLSPVGDLHPYTLSLEKRRRVELRDAVLQTATQSPRVRASVLARAVGFEPTRNGLEPFMLPLHQTLKLAPRPGLEPGAFGLTGRLTYQS